MSRGVLAEEEAHDDHHDQARSADLEATSPEPTGPRRIALAILDVIALAHVLPTHAITSSLVGP